MNAEARVVRPSRAGTILLRIALAGGVFVVATFLATARSMPGASEAVMKLVDASFDVSMICGMIAPFLAIIGAILVFRARRRLTALDWISFAFGLIAGLLPVLFVYAYSNCPNGIC